jgi:hypothetical protein
MADPVKNNFISRRGGARKLFFPGILALGLCTLVAEGAGLAAASAVAWSQDAYGYAFNAKSIEEAEQLARAAAVKNGAQLEDVKILATSEVEGYGAIAVDGNILGATLGYPDLRAAMARARQECIKRGGRFPRVVATWHDRGY